MTLFPDDARCSTTTTVAGRLAGRPAARRVRASTPPADAPMTTRERPPAPISPSTLRLGSSAHRTSEAPAQRAPVVRRHLDGDDVGAALELRDLHLRRARLGQRESATRYALLVALDRDAHPAGRVDVEGHPVLAQRDVGEL